MNVKAPVVFVLCIGLSWSLDLKSIMNHRNWQYLPKSCGYGITPDKIIRGIKASLGQFPWMVRLIYSENNTIFSACAGSIINNWYVLSAGHCASGDLGRTLKAARVGENFVDTEIDCEEDFCAPEPVDIPIKYAVRHFKYPNRLDSSPPADISIIRTKNRITFNDFVQPICLPNELIIRNIQEEMSIGTEIQVAGWGMTDSINKHYPDKLMYVTMPVVPMEECSKRFPIDASPSQICIGESYGKDSCVGDSGGPAMKAFALDGPPKYYLMGIVSYGAKLCGTHVAVYTNTSYYMDWILDHVVR